jgi:hypothetical protein
MNKEFKYYTVYQITNKINNKVYIGVHRTNNLKDTYFGSGTLIKKAIKKHGRKVFKKEILFIFNNEEEMLAKELELVNEEFIERKDTYNLVLGGETCPNTTGFIPVRDKKGNCFLVEKDDPRYISGEVLHTSKGYVAVKDKEGTTFNVKINDSRYLSGELVGITKDLVLVKDDKDNIFYVEKTDKRYLNGEVVGLTKGYFATKDKKGNIFHITKNDSRYLSGELVGITKGIKIESNLKNKILNLRKKGFSYNKISKELNCSKSVIAYHCKNESLIDVGKKIKPISEEVQLKIKSYRKEHTIKETMKQFKISKCSVIKYQ